MTPFKLAWKITQFIFWLTLLLGVIPTTVFYGGIFALTAARAEYRDYVNRKAEQASLKTNCAEWKASQELDIVQHPVLGELKFPKSMNADERNAAIDRALAARLDALAQKHGATTVESGHPRFVPDYIPRTVPLDDEFIPQTAEHNTEMEKVCKGQ
jgi:biopolymer transport protein ExbB/TolQ